MNDPVAMRKSVLMTLAAIALWVCSQTPTWAANLNNGAKVFNTNCAACHVGGNNVVIASKTLRQAALEKYNMASIAAIKQQVTHGKNAMPAFGKRLSEQQIEDVAAYVLQQAKSDWQNR